MKNLKYLIIFILGLLIIPNVFAAENVSIESVDVLERSEGTDIVTPAEFNELNIKFDIKFVNKDDYIKYKVVVVNNSNKDYKIVNTNKFKDSDYIKYYYSFNNDNNTVKAHSKQTMTITIRYENLVPEDKMNADGSFTEVKNMVVSLDRGTSFIRNPQTSGTIMILLILVTIVVCITSIIGIKRNNSVQTMLFIIGIIGLTVPVTIFAIENIQIKVNSKVTINSEMEFCVRDMGLTTNLKAERKKSYMETQKGTPTEFILAISYRYKYIRGMNWNDFKSSKYYNQVGNEKPTNQNTFEEIDNGVSKLKQYFNDLDSYNIIYVDSNGIEERANLNDKIIPCSEGTYIIREIDED